MSRGVSRIEQRLKSKIDDGDYYEAHQMYRTIASRYKTSNKIGDALQLTHEGASMLYKKDQSGSASDLGLLYCSMLDETKEISDTVLNQIQSLHLLTIENLAEDQPERDQFEKRVLQRSIDISGEKFGSPDVRRIFAKNYFLCAKNMKNSQVGTRLLINARGHFQYANDGKLIAEFLIMYSQFGDPHEVEYFCCQMTVQLLYRKAVKTAEDFFQSYCQFHPTLKTQTFPFEQPLINFTHFLLCAIREVQSPDVFLYLKATYEPLLHLPDPSLRDYVDSLGEMYFGIVRKSKSKDGGGLFGMIQNMMGGMDDHESDDDEPTGGGPPRIDMSSIMNMANDMMSGMMSGNQNSQPRRAQPRPQSRPPPKSTPEPEEDVDDLD